MLDFPETLIVALPYVPSGAVNSASKGEADIPEVPMASDGAGAPSLFCWYPIFPAFESEETPETGFSESPGMVDGAIGVEGDKSQMDDVDEACRY